MMICPNQIRHQSHRALSKLLLTALIFKKFEQAEFSGLTSRKRITTNPADNFIINFPKRVELAFRASHLLIVIVLQVSAPSGIGGNLI